jgi:hypothetical protein
MFWKRRKDRSGDFDEDLAIRRLLEAASGERGDAQPPPFFVARVRARAATARGPGTEQLLGTTSWRMLPALAAIVVALSAWTGYESAEASRDRADLVANTLGQAGASEILIAAMLMGGSEESGGAK